MPNPKKSVSRKNASFGVTIREAERYLANTYKRPKLVFTHGKGCTLYDQRGRAYLDFLGGIAVNALGYAHPRLVRTLRREAGRLTHVSNLFHNPYQGPLARKLAKWSGMDRVFFANSGAEAVEAALKLARAYAHSKHDAGKTKILALENSFHGRTFGAVSITWPEKYRKPFEPLVPGAEFVRFNDVADLEAKFDESVCAVIMEPIQGEGGIRTVSEGFWNRARELASQHDAALIADEIQCGLGRTGRAFAYQKFASQPDIVLVAKPLAGGLPLGAMMAKEKFASAFSPGMHGSTFGGGPLVCAVALEFLRVVEENGLFANARDRGAELRAGLEQLSGKFDFVTEIRGEGLMQGMQLTMDGQAFVDEALRRGLLINCTQQSTLRFVPPFIIMSSQVKDFLTRMEAVLAKTPRTQPKKAAVHAVRSASRAGDTQGKRSLVAAR
ncbi:MAG TPA: aspartate aminotransferase family protein [Candidatus Acidoferrales bacterium]|nr:aspartate aminotransferase family protein [Candidatus Acidoferrales bacterium]